LIVRSILQELNRDQPWFYIRNLVNLLATTPRDDIVQTVARHVSHQEERVRKACVGTLIKVGNKSSHQILLDVLDVEDESITKNIVNYFGQIRSKMAADPLMNLLSDKSLAEDKPDLVGEIIYALGRIGSSESVDVLASLIKRGGLLGLFQKRNDEILLSVLKAFSMMNDEKAASIAAKYVRDKNPEIARAAKIASQSTS
jgi:HEAT repeat protein